MARAVQITCDVCGKVKQEANHWFRARVDKSGAVTIYLSNSGNPLPKQIAKDLLDLCGESCVLKKVSELIGVQARAPESPQ